MFFWTLHGCSLYAKVNLEGDVAVVHEHNNTIDYRNGEIEYDSDGEFEIVDWSRLWEQQTNLSFSSFGIDNFKMVR